MEKQDEGPPDGLEARLEHMDRETVDVIDDARTDAGWQRDRRNRSIAAAETVKQSPADQAGRAKPYCV